jgi:hypothetical protein
MERMVYRARLTVVVAAAIALAGPRPAVAQTPEAVGVPRSEALSFGEEGLKRFQGAHWKEAYALFRRADAAAHAPTLVLYMAHCQARLGELGAARRLYRAVTREHLAEDAPLQFRTAQRVAAQELHGIEPRIAPLALIVAGVPEGRARVLVDGAEVPAGEVTDLALDPGDHVVEVTAPGGATLRRPIHAVAGRPLEITLVFDPAPIAPPPAPLPAPAPAPPPPPPKAPHLLTGAAIAFGTGGAALTASLVTGVLSLRGAASIKSQCLAGRCPATDAGSAASTDRLADATTGTLVVGAIAVVAGAALAIAHARGVDPPTSALRFAPGFAGGVF